MAAYFTLTLDTTAPSGGSISIPSLASSTNITATLAATGATQMKLYGDITAASTESAAEWETYTTSKTITLTDGDGDKTVYVKFRDAVGNETSAYSAVSTLDTTASEVALSGPDVSTVSKVAGYDESTFTFTVDDAFVAYAVMVVSSSAALYASGTQIPTTNGSLNMTGSGSFAANTAISCTINGADLEAASPGDGAKIIKVFVQDAAGNWST